MNGSNIIVIPDKCVGCNACVRNCPAPEANITKCLEGGKFVTTINPLKCISCGECVRTCHHGARDYLDDTEVCMSQLSAKKIIILVAPAIKSALPNQWKGILDWFKKKGCLVYDVSLGADICSWAHLRAIESGKVGNIITQPCAAIVNYLEMYQPKLLKNLSPIQSPIGCSAVYIKKYLRRNNPIAVLSPCIAKKTEFEETGLVDYSVTFEKLLQYFDKNDIKIPKNDTDDFFYNFDDTQGQLGSIFPRPGGLRDNLWQRNIDINIATSEGVHKVYPELDLYAQLPDYKQPKVLDVLSCEHGCNIGPGSGTEQSCFDVMSTMRQIEHEAKEKIRGKGLFKTGEDKLLKKFDEELNIDDFMRNYKPMTVTPVPSDKDLEPIYLSLGKHTEASRHYDCHACGYPSCKHMAISIYRGLNTPHNCLVHAKNVLLSRHSELMAHHEKMADITQRCFDMSTQLQNEIKEVVKSVEAMNNSSNSTNEKATIVHDLLKNIILFCNNNPTMDSDSVSQLVKILETTVSAFGTLDENINISKESNKTISKAIADINDMIVQINSTLREAENC